jgi:riboflavin kinase/FMN adenylyltransferase
MMQIFQSIDDFLLSKQERIALTIGNFDGLHQGHTHLLKILRQEADKCNVPSVVLTFKQHTSVQTNPDSPKIILTNTKEKSKLITDSGLVNFLILQDFNNDFRSISAQDFIQNILVKKLKIKLIVIGQNHRFGKDRLGDINLLKIKSIDYDFKVVVADLFAIDGEIISSSLIRNRLK